nr:MAG TPA: (p)ppGpp synthetase, RelA/SpoT family [Caudoviricetes sp.]
MIYTKMINKALNIAYKAHHGQKDKGNVPYIFHPYHIAEKFNNETDICVAILHDVLEDTFVSKEELEGYFPKEVIEPLVLLTKSTHDTYFEYIKNICSNPIARKVKIEDIKHNLVFERIQNKKRNEKLEKRYLKALEILKNN